MFALVGGVVAQLRQGVGDAEAEAAAEAPLDADLQPVVDRASGVLGQPDRAVAQVGTQRRDVDARVGLDRARLQLVEVALALQVQPPAADVRDVCHDAPRQLALQREAPVVGGRVLELDVLRRHHEREVLGGGAARHVGRPVGDADLGLERRVAAEQRRVVERDAVVEDAGPRAQDGLGIDRPGDAEARLEHVAWVSENPRGSPWNSAGTAGRRPRAPVAGLGREPVPGQHDAVEAVARRGSPRSSGRSPRPGAGRRSAGRSCAMLLVVVPRRPVGVAHAALERQVAARPSRCPGRRRRSPARATW